MTEGLTLPGGETSKIFLGRGDLLWAGASFFSPVKCHSRCPSASRNGHHVYKTQVTATVNQPFLDGKVLIAGYSESEFAELYLRN